MTTATCLPQPLVLHRPWWLRALDHLQEVAERRLRRDVERDLYGGLAHLDNGTLRDIGAPESMQRDGRDLELWRLERATW
jgi:hypothetical protein